MAQGVLIIIIGAAVIGWLTFGGRAADVAETMLGGGA